MKLKRCPFCGGKALPLSIGTPRFPFKVGCVRATCGVQTPWLRTPEVARAIWNRRTS